MRGPPRTPVPRRTIPDHESTARDGVADLRPAHTAPPRAAPAAHHSHAFTFAGAELIACATGVLYWPARRTLLVADLHLEKASHFARRGSLLPPYDTRETLDRLAVAIARHQPASVIVLGDSLHDAGASDRIASDDLNRLHAVQNGLSWVWVTGNHDRVLSARLGGTVTDGLDVAGIAFRHIPSVASNNPEIAGHLHPAARMVSRGQSIRRPCFAVGPTRLVLPAFGTFTGGLNVRDPAFEAIGCGRSLQVVMIGRDGVYRVPTRLLHPD